MASELGKAFVQAIAARDEATLLELLAPDVDFRAMTPARFWECHRADDLVADILLGTWFEESEHVEAVESLETETIADTERVGYRLRVVNRDGPFAVAQQAYYRESGGRITWLRVMCAGYRRLNTASS
jgi:hypothetical protein